MKLFYGMLLTVTLLAAQSDPLLQGLQAFQKGDYVTAERELRTALKRGDDSRAQAFLALTLAATNRFDEARPALEKAFAGSDKTTSRLAGIALVQCHLAANQIDPAAKVVDRLKQAYPDDADVLYQAARLHMRAWNDTIYQLYQKAPASFRVNQLSGEILETMGQFSEAAAEYRKAIEKSPTTLALHFRLGRALLLASHSPEALEAARQEFLAELKLNPQDAIAEYQVAQVLDVQQKNAEAIPHFEQALKLQPDFAEVLIALGKIRVEQKKYDEAVSLLERAVKLMPQSEPAHYNLMLAYRNSGRMADARKEKAALDKLQKAPEGEFSEFLKKLGEKPAGK